MNIHQDQHNRVFFIEFKMHAFQFPLADSPKQTTGLLLRKIGICM